MTWVTGSRRNFGNYIDNCPIPSHHYKAEISLNVTLHYNKTKPKTPSEHKKYDLNFLCIHRELKVEFECYNYYMYVLTLSKSVPI